MPKRSQKRPQHANVGNYGTNAENTCPSGDQHLDFGKFINVMLHPAKFQRKLDTKYIDCVIDLFEGGEVVFIATDTIGEFYWPRGSYGDKKLRTPVVAQACAQLIGSAKPRSVAEYVLPVITKVIDNLGVNGPETILYVTNRDGYEEPMYAPEYAQMIETTALATVAEYGAPPWVAGTDPADFFTLVRRRGLWNDDSPPEEEKQDVDLQPALPTSGEIDEDEQWCITKRDIETCPACPEPKYKDVSPTVGPPRKAVLSSNATDLQSAIAGASSSGASGASSSGSSGKAGARGGPAPKVKGGAKSAAPPAKTAPGAGSGGPKSGKLAKSGKSAAAAGPKSAAAAGPKSAAAAGPKSAAAAGPKSAAAAGPKSAAPPVKTAPVASGAGKKALTELGKRKCTIAHHPVRPDKATEIYRWNPTQLLITDITDTPSVCFYHAHTL